MGRDAANRKVWIVVFDGGDSNSSNAEELSVLRVIELLKVELEMLGIDAPAAQLYAALIDGLEKVYFVSRSS